MDKYLAVLCDRSGRWTSGPLSQAYVFEAEDDDEAIRVIVSYCGGLYLHKIELLGRITCGLHVQKVHIHADVYSDMTNDITKLSYKRGLEIGFDHLAIGEAMISQLQPFNQEVREKRLAAIKESQNKADRAQAARN